MSRDGKDKTMSETNARDYIKMLIQKEMEFHKNQDNKNLSDSYKTGFIDGLGQALLIINESASLTHGLIK